MADSKYGAFSSLSPCASSPESITPAPNPLAEYTEMTLNQQERLAAYPVPVGTPADYEKEWRAQEGFHNLMCTDTHEMGRK